MIVLFGLLALGAGAAEERRAIVAEVLEKNPELEFYRAEIDAGRAERRAAGARANPEIATEVGSKRVRGGGLSDEGIAWSVSVQQTFEWPGRVPLRKAIANRQMDLAELGLKQFEQALAARANVLVYSLFAAQERSGAAQAVANRFRQLREALVQRDPAGVTPELELRIIEATELTLQREATEASLALQSAILELNQLRGAPWTNTISVAPVALSFEAPPEDQALLAAAKTNNFELQMRRMELARRTLGTSLAKKEGYPSFTVGPYYSQEKAGEREQQFGLGLSMPIPIPGRNKGNVDAAAARERQAETALFMAERDLERRVLERATAYRAKLAEIGKWRPEAVEEFRKAAELADEHYRLGAVPIATYVELQKQYLEAMEALFDTRREALEAERELERLTGMKLNAEAGGQ